MIYDICNNKEKVLYMTETNVTIFMAMFWITDLDHIHRIHHIGFSTDHRIFRKP